MLSAPRVPVSTSTAIRLASFFCIEIDGHIVSNGFFEFDSPSIFFELLADFVFPVVVDDSSFFAFGHIDAVSLHGFAHGWSQIQQYDFARSSGYIDWMNDSFFDQVLFGVISSSPTDVQP